MAKMTPIMVAIIIYLAPLFRSIWVSSQPWGRGFCTSLYNSENRSAKKTYEMVSSSALQIELCSNRVMSGSNPHVEIKSCSSFLDLGSDKGNKTPWRESKTSRISCLGKQPLANFVSGSLTGNWYRDRYSHFERIRGVGIVASALGGSQLLLEKRGMMEDFKDIVPPVESEVVSHVMGCLDCYAQVLLEFRCP